LEVLDELKNISLRFVT